MASVKMADAFYVPGVIRYFCYRGRRQAEQLSADFRFADIISGEKLPALLKAGSPIAAPVK